MHTYRSSFEARGVDSQLTRALFLPLRSRKGMVVRIKLNIVTVECSDATGMCR